MNIVALGKNNKLHLILLFALFWSVSCYRSTTDKGENGGNADGNNILRLHTSGNRIFDENDQIVFLHGVNRSGLEYDNPDGNRMSEEEFNYICQQWKANIIRIPFNQEWITSDPAYQKKIDNVIKWINQNDAYVILDLQWRDTVTRIPPIPDTAAVSMWKNLAVKYKNYPGVLFDIHNETHDTVFSQWRARAIEIIEVIRSVNPDVLILVSGMNWSSDLKEWAASPLAYENIVYSLHIYPWHGGSDGWAERFGNFSADIPIFCGEFGGDDSSVEWGKEFIRYLNKLQIGWCAWSWVDDPHLTLREDHTTPTPFGSLVKSSLEKYALMRAGQNSIKNLRTENITGTRVTISWETNWEANSLLFYGKSKVYSDSVKAAALLKLHTIKLQNLIPSTVYYYQAVSVDEIGFIFTSSDTTFATLTD